MQYWLHMVMRNYWRQRIEEGWNRRPIIWLRGVRGRFDRIRRHPAEPSAFTWRSASILSFGESGGAGFPGVDGGLLGQGHPGIIQAGTSRVVFEICRTSAGAKRGNFRGNEIRSDL